MTTNEPVANTITGTDEWGDPVDLTVMTQEHHAGQITLVCQRTDQPDIVAALALGEPCLSLYDGLDAAVASAAVQITVLGTDADGTPLPLHLEAGGVYAGVLLAFGPDGDPAVLLDADGASNLRDAYGAALAAASDWQCPSCAEPVQHMPPTTNQTWAQAWVAAHGRALPHWSHTDGEPLCPVLGAHGGYEPAHPVPVTNDTDGM